MATSRLTPGAAERTILTYVKIEMRKQWEYFCTDYSFRPVDDDAELLVVTELEGKLQTHFFKVRRRPDSPVGGHIDTDGVVIPQNNNIIFIPEKCSRVEKGDQTTHC